jgi:hypothetical protein
MLELRSMKAGNLKKILTWYNAASALVLILILIVTLSFYHYWKAGYSSDSAMIGLMAKSILERGERPIYVWSIGYQGILLEAYATALVFKVFGMNPFTLSLFNMVCLWGVFTAFYFYLREFLDSWIALLATAFLALSSFDFYRNVIRTQPNYTETYLFGILLFWLSHLLIRHFYVEKQLPSRRSDLCFAGFGFIAGFATYTYGQIAYFLAAICLQLSFIYIRDLLHVKKEAWARILRWKLVKVAVGYFTIQLVVAVVLFFLNLSEIPFPGKPMHFNPPARIQVSLLFFGIISFIDVIVRYPVVLFRLFKGASICLISFVLGYSPQLYFKWVQHGFSSNKTTVNGTLNDFVQRLSIAFFGNLNALNAQLGSPIRVVFTITLLSALCIFSFYCWKRAWSFIRSYSERKEVLMLSPLLFLPWVVLPIFSVASTVSDDGHARYALVLLLFHVIALSWAIVSLIRKAGTLRVLGCVFLLSILLNNATSLITAIRFHEGRAFPGEPAIAELKKRGIRFGYSNYWLAYTVNFFTSEDIILEPTSTNYSPHYGPLIRNEKVVMLVDYEPHTPDLIAKDGHLTVHGIAYEVLEAWQKDNLNFSVLKRIM